MASKHHVLIVGAGTGGLMLAMLLERASISYEVFEKAKEVRPLGSAIVITSLMHVFEQLGMKDDILAMSKPFGALHIRDETLRLKGSFFVRPPYSFDNKVRYGDYPTVMARPDLIALLLSHVPAHKIHYNKRVVNAAQDENKVLIQCHDGSEHSGTILVGADGAYSTVRHNMYKELEKAGTLPPADTEPLSYDYDCVVGITKSLDLESYAVFLEKFCEFEVVLGKEIPFTVWHMPLTDRRCGWMVVQDLRNQSSADTREARSEWGPDAAIDMCSRVRHFPCPLGGTFGDILDSTPKDVISKVVLENKFFNTWHHGRTVLLGDACSKMVPFGGQGANMAILSAVELANFLYDATSVAQDETTRIFREYYETRHKISRISVEQSNQNGALIHKRGLLGDIARYLFLHWVPTWLIQMHADQFNVYRPQVSFLPFVKLRGSFKSKTSKPSRRMQAESH
ncbi:unnamed protein product [Mortierella alpina]